MPFVILDETNSHINPRKPKIGKMIFSASKSKIVLFWRVLSGERYSPNLISQDKGIKARLIPNKANNDTNNKNGS